MKVWYLLLATLMLLLVPSLIDAELHDRGNGLIYDDVLDVTWLQDANLAATETFGVGGIGPGGEMTWVVAQEWIAAMSAANYLGFNTWRLPETVQPDPNCTTQEATGEGSDGNCILSEMPHLHTVTLGNPYEPTTDCEPNCMPNVGPFQNVVRGEAEGLYWSATERAIDPSEAWMVATYCGGQCHESKNFVIQGAWPLFDGDVAVPTVTPTALVFLALLLIGVAWWVFR